MEQQRSTEDVVRDALSAYVRSARRVLPQGVGKYHSGQSDVSEQARDILRDATRSGQWP